MNGWLVDTNVLSELRRPRPNRNVVQFVAAQPDLLIAATALHLGLTVVSRDTADSKSQTSR